MNERMQELYDQAFTLGTSGYSNGELDVEQFAELIVKECADLFVDQRYMILNPHEPFANERVRALKEHDKDTVRKIRKHFGVKE
jgi:hypothetical protein